jgi:ubiquinone/menaquinone biosynthesis C-methylase UbiE
MNIKDSYNSWSSSYDTDRNLTRDLDAEIVREEFAGKSFKRILELGCGTGKNTGFFASIADELYAVDFSEGMMRQAKEKLKDEKIHFIAADISLAWPVESSSFDLIAINLVLEHVEDLNHIFSEAFRCLSPDGQLFICELHPDRQLQGKKATFIHNGTQKQIPAILHTAEDYKQSAKENKLTLLSMQSLRHKEDKKPSPRVIKMCYKKASPWF